MNAKFTDLTVVNTAIISITFFPVGAILGLLSSFLVHTFSPEYYSLVFNVPSEKGLAVGIGTGISQGIGAGVLLAATFIMAVAISQKEKASSFAPPIHAPTTTQNGPKTRI